MRSIRNPWMAGLVLVAMGFLAPLGCYHTPIEFAKGPAPRRMPSPGTEDEGCHCYEDTLTGGQIFTMYCSYCHNAPSLAERPFASYKNVASHMRVRANLTGKEYAKLIDWLRRWHDVPPSHPPVEPSPKRLIFAQQIAELRPQTPEKKAPAQAPVVEETAKPDVQP